MGEKEPNVHRVIFGELMFTNAEMNAELKRHNLKQLRAKRRIPLSYYRRLKNHYLEHHREDNWKCTNGEEGMGWYLRRNGTLKKFLESTSPIKLDMVGLRKQCDMHLIPYKREMVYDRLKDDTVLTKELEEPEELYTKLRRHY